MKTIITYITILTSFSMMSVGCYSEKRASKQLLKVQTNYPSTIAKLCGSIYPSIESVKDSIVYLQGVAQEELVYVEVDCDSVSQNVSSKTNIVKRPCPPSILRVDTLLVYKETQVVNRAKVSSLEMKLSELTTSFIEIKKEKYILLRIAIILGIYTLLRWLLRIWHVKIP